MNMRRLSLACALAGLSLTFLLAPAHADPAPAAADTPAVTVVRHFLAARTAGRYDEAYKLLLFSAKMPLSAQQFAAGDVAPAGTEKRLPAPVFALMDLFADTHNTRKYTFEVVGADPADPSVILVRATPPAGSALPAATVGLVTALDDSLALRVSAYRSVLHAVPPLTGAAARRAESLSHLGQLGIAVIQYMQDHDEIMPDADKWADEILPYVKDKAVFKDPSAPAGQTWGYAYNRTLSRKTLAETMSPETTVMLFQSTKGVKNASDTGQSVPRPGRDGGGASYAFADGHARWVKDGTKPSFSLSGK